jgi:hypothetical protein
MTNFQSGSKLPGPITTDLSQFAGVAESLLGVFSQRRWAVRPTSHSEAIDNLARAEQSGFIISQERSFLPILEPRYWFRLRAIREHESSGRDR